MNDNPEKSSGFSEGIIDALATYSTGQNTAAARYEKCSSMLPPLHTRLQKLLDEIPVSAQRKGLSLMDLQICLRGRKGGKPHVGELAEAMRRLGWQRRRQWSNESASFSAKWHPADPIQSRSDD